MLNTEFNDNIGMLESDIRKGLTEMIVNSMVVKLMEKVNEEGEQGACELQRWNKQAANLITVNSLENLLPQLISLRSALTLVPARPSWLSLVRVSSRVGTSKPQTSYR